MNQTFYVKCWDIKLQKESISKKGIISQTKLKDTYYETHALIYYAVTIFTYISISISMYPIYV